MAQVFQELTINFSASKIRHEIMDGRKYLVAPAVLLTNDVHAGNNGPVFYSEEQLAKNPSVWDHKPIVVYHPQDKDGNYTKACTPTILESRGCGILLNTHYDTKLRTECWFDEEKTKRVDKRVFEALEQEKLTEVSTGLFLDVEEPAGEFNGKPYVGSACNFAPDHLAVLPDKIGACSVAAGGGLFQVNEGPKPIAVNEQSYQRIASAVRDALESKSGYMCYVRDVYDSFFIYSDGNDQLYRQTYSIDKDGNVTLGKDPVAVKWVTEYRTEAGLFVGNSNYQSSIVKESNVDKKAYIDFLITANVGWEESDRTMLDGMPEPKLKALHDKAKAPVTPPVTPPAPVPVTTNDKTTLAPAISLPVPKVPSLQEFIANNAPPELQEPLMEMVQSRDREKAGLVQAITANKLNRFTPEWLGSQKVEVLRNLAAVAAPVITQPNYSGMATLPMTSNTEYEQEPLADIGLDFTKK